MFNENEEKIDQRMNEIVESLPTNKKDEGTDDSKRQSQADRLVGLANKENCVLFHDQYHTPYARILVNGHWETWKIRSNQFKYWLGTRLWEGTKKSPSANAMASALGVIEGKAYYHGKMFRLETRVAFFENAIWYDLTNEKWQAVRITETGWEIIDHPPILFVRYPHQLPQATPVKSASGMSLLDPFLNFAKTEVQQLFKVYLTSCIIPGIHHPIPILYGPQGAAKSTLAKIVKLLIDPSSLGLLGRIPNSNDALIQQLSHHWFAFYDNISHLPEWVSDAFCRAVTGEGSSKRALYSDDDDIVYNFIRCIGLNGINLAAQKPDLLDRSILLQLDRIGDEKRRTDKEFWEEFEKVRPLIVAAIFDALSLAMRIKPSVEIEELPRMSDFAHWGCAIAQAIDLSAEEFLVAYRNNINDQHDEAVQENPVALALIRFIDQNHDWSGSASELLTLLEPIAEKEKLSGKGTGWPKTANVLSRRINEVKTNLEEKGLKIDSSKGSNGRRTIRIRNIQKNIVNTATSEEIDKVKAVFGDAIVVVDNDLPPESPNDIALPFDENNSSGNSGDISNTRNN